MAITWALGREINAVASEEWRRFSRVLDKSYDALSDLPADSSEWPVVARELSGLYAAWSRRLEGTRPGPLARAADLLAQAGQVAPSDTPLPRSAARGYRGAAMVVSQAFLGSDDRGTGWAMLLVELGRHLDLVAQIQAARGQRRLSTQLAAAVSELERPVQRWVRQVGRGRPVQVHDRPRVLTQSGAPTGASSRPTSITSLRSSTDSDGECSATRVLLPSMLRPPCSDHWN